MYQHQSDGAATAILPKRVPAIYVRSATDGEGQLDERLADTRELARSRGLEVAEADIVGEVGSGARIDTREGVQQLLLRAQRGEISHIVCMTRSSPSRNRQDTQYIQDLLEKAGVTIVTMNDDLVVSAGAELAQAIANATAQ
jgi:DNA invertase Pin-like site-specific DNA recombinase